MNPVPSGLGSCMTQHPSPELDVRVSPASPNPLIFYCLRNILGREATHHAVHSMTTMDYSVRVWKYLPKGCLVSLLHSIFSLMTDDVLLTLQFPRRTLHLALITILLFI